MLKKPTNNSTGRISDLEIQESVNTYEIADEPIDELLSGGMDVDYLIRMGMLDDEWESPQEKAERLLECSKCFRPRDEKYFAALEAAGSSDDTPF